MSHVQLNPSATKVMMRLSVANCPVFGALGCIDLETGKTHVIPDKPVHQLWFDDDTYMATRQYYDGSKIEMETSCIQRFTPDGECIETLGGIGNHIDGSPDRSYFVGDRAYPGYPADIFLYRRGETTPIATFGDKTSKTVLGNFRFIQTQPSHAMENEFTLTTQLARTAQKLVLLKSMSY